MSVNPLYRLSQFKKLIIKIKSKNEKGFEKDKLDFINFPIGSQHENIIEQTGKKWPILKGRN